MSKIQPKYDDLVINFLEEVINFDSIISSFKKELESNNDFSSGLTDVVNSDDKLEKQLELCLNSVSEFYDSIEAKDAQLLKLKIKDTLVKLNQIFEKRSSLYWSTLKESKDKFEFDWLGARDYYRLELLKRRQLLERLLLYFTELVELVKAPQIQKIETVKSSPGHFDMKKWQAVLYGWFMCKIGRWEAKKPAELGRFFKGFTYSDKNGHKHTINKVETTFARTKKEHHGDDEWMVEQKKWFKQQLTDLTPKEEQIIKSLKLPYPKGEDTQNNYYF